MNRPAFVVSSEVTVDAGDAGLLTAAFQARVRLVEAAQGFQRLEVWSDLVRPGVFQMVSWWDSEETFRSYMRSTEHRVSHARIADLPRKPKGTGVRRYALVPDLPVVAVPEQPAVRCPVRG